MMGAGGLVGLGSVAVLGAGLALGTGAMSPSLVVPLLVVAGVTAAFGACLLAVNGSMRERRRQTDGSYLHVDGASCDGDPGGSDSAGGGE